MYNASSREARLAGDFAAALAAIRVHLASAADMIAALNLSRLIIFSSNILSTICFATAKGTYS